jgi:hypothetical protein
MFRGQPRFFTTARHSSYSDSNSITVFPRSDAPSSWSAFAQGEQLCHGTYSQLQSDSAGFTGCDRLAPYHLGAGNVASIDDIPNLLASLHNRDESFITETVSTSADVPTSFAEVSVDSQFGSSGVFIRNMWSTTHWQGGAQKSSSILTRTDLAVNLVATPSGVYAWVTSQTSLAPVAGANVHIFRVQNTYGSPSSSDVTQLAHAETDADGIALLTVPSSGHTYASRVYCVVEHDGELTVTDGVTPTSASEPSPKAVLVTDRAVYKLGNVVHVKGYVRTSVGTTLEVPTGLYSYNVNWGNGVSVPAVDISVDQQTGTLDFELEIPADASYAEHQITLHHRAAGDEKLSFQIGQQKITVADPRPPTVTLTVDAVQDWVTVAGTCPLRIETKTYTGSPVPATVTVNWSASATVGGSFTVDVSDSGLTTHEFQMDLLADAIAPGDTVSFSAEWVGPTREVIQASTAVTVSNSAWRLSVTASAASPLPGFDFGTFVDVQDVVTGASLAGQQVSTTLYEIGTGATISSTDGPIDVGAIVGSTCSRTADSGSAMGCIMQLPSIGNFIVVACAEDPSEALVCAALPLGLTTEQWAENPLLSLSDGVSLIPDASEYQIGSTATFNFYNPFTSARALMVQGNNGDQVASTTDILTGGPSEVSLTVGDECMGGCQVSIILVSAIQSAGSFTLPLGVHASTLFDATIPSVIVSSHSIVVPDVRTVTASVEPANEVQTPGSTATFDIILLDSDGEPTAGEVAVFVVDEAFLSLKPHPQVDVQAELTHSGGGADFRVSSNLEDVTGLSGYEASKARLQELHDGNPWLQIWESWWPLRAGDNAAFDQPAATYLQAQAQYITDQPPVISPWSRGGFGGGGVYMEGGMVDDEMMVMPASVATDSMDSMADMEGASMERTPSPSPPPPPGAKAAGASPSPPGGITADIPVRTNFETVPLFAPKISVGASGRATVTWNVPDNLGSFNIRAYAITPSGQTAVAEASQIVRKDFNLVPSIPRISRAGDIFSCGVLVTAADLAVHNDVAISVAVASSGLVLTSAATQTVTIDGPTEITWSFESRGLDSSASLTFTLVAGEDTDAFQTSLSVLSPQGTVFLATSMALQAAAAKTPWMEAVQLPEAIAGSGSLVLTAGVGYLPVVRELCSELLELPNPRWHNGHALVTSLAAAPILAQYVDSSDALLVEAQGVFASSVESLQSLTDEYGLRYSQRIYSYRRSTDTYLNAHACTVIKLAENSGFTIPAALSSMSDTWTAKMTQGVIDSAKNAREYGHAFQSYDLQARVRFVLGSQWEAEISQVLDSNGRDVSADVELDLSLQALVAAARSRTCSTYCRAATAVLLLRTNPSDVNAAILLQDFTDSIRVQGRTAYFATAAGSPHAADMQTHSLLLHAHLLSADPMPTLLLQKVARRARPSYHKTEQYF